METPKTAGNHSGGGYLEHIAGNKREHCDSQYRLHSGAVKDPEPKRTAGQNKHATRCSCDARANGSSPNTPP